MTLSLSFQSHIVVVDSRPNDYRVLPRLAEEHGWHIHFLTSARAAVRFVRSAGVDLWMISVRLPDMSGFELLEALREQLIGTPVFIVTERYDEEEERRACSYGAAMYLSKGDVGADHADALLNVLVGQRGAIGEPSPTFYESRHTSSFP
jgi:CheY-like chemotaxis protein